VTRFRTAHHLASWAGLTPSHHESDTTVHRGHITKQGSRLVRWAAVEAVAHQRGDTALRALQHRVADRRGRSIGRVAAARKLVTLVYYGLKRRRGPLPGPGRGVTPGPDAAWRELAICHGPRRVARPPF